MKVLVIGASGRVGYQLVEALIEDGYKVVGTTRKKEKLFKDANYEQINLDITGPLDVIEKDIPENTDVIIFVSGSRGKDLLQVDLHGAVKTMQAAENKGIKRYVMLSALFSLQPDKWYTLIDYYTAKYFADLYLMNQTKLDYTIVQPGYLAETTGNGKIQVDESKLDIKGEVSIRSVALTIKAVIKNKNTIGKRIPFLDGDTTIDEAVSQL